MISTSMIRGTLVRVVRPSASSAAAITLSTLFLAPVTRTSPASRAPPTTRNLSMPGIVGSAPSPSLDGMVNLTRIYTRTGDDGTTGYGGRGRISKNDPRLEAYADCDEAGAFLGVALASGALTDDVAAVLTRVQNDLFDVGADLCTPIEPRLRKYPPLRVAQEQVDALEREIDRFNADLEPLRSFVLAGGTPRAAHLHVARTVVRRAERATWRGGGGPPGHGQPGDGHLPEPAVRPAVRAGPAREPRGRRRAVGPGANR